MLRFSPIFKVALSMVTVVAIAAPLHAAEPIDDPVHIDELAAAVQTAANSLCWEMHRYHRQQAGFAETYRTAKDLWASAGALRDSIRAGADSAAVAERVAQMLPLLYQSEKQAAGWGDGIRPSPSSVTVQTPGESIVVTPDAGVAIDVPFVGIRVGRPRAPVAQVVPAQPQLARRNYHPNSRGSRKSLDREFAAVRTLLGYLAEDTGVVQPAEAGPNPTPTAATAGPTLGAPTRIGPPSPPKPGNPK